MNRITGKITNGIYKDQNFEMEIGETWADSMLKVNGTMLTGVQKVTFIFEINKVNKININTLSKPRT